MSLVASPILRVVFAIYLAILTPATCCCAIKGVLGRVTGAAEMSCGSVCGGRMFGGMVSPPRSNLVESSSCCARTQSDSTEEQEHDSSKQCHCHEQSTDLQRPDSTVTKLAASLPQPELPLAFLDIDFGGNYSPRFAKATISRWKFERPPPASLLAQRCLLII